MLIVGCQSCGEAKILAGTPDADGVARVKWTCRHCGTGQILQLEVSGDARNADLRSILCGLALQQKDDGDGESRPVVRNLNGTGGKFPY